MLRILATALALACAAPALAQECTMTTSQADVDTGILYIDNDCGPQGCAVGLVSIWVYQESNGLAGLQRGDEMHDDTCGRPELADTILV